MPCMKTSSASDMFLLVCQYTNKEGLETILLHHWKHCTLFWPRGILNHLWGPHVPGLPWAQEPSAAAVPPCVWQDRHSYQWWPHRVTGSTDSCHCTPKIWAEPEPVLLVKQPHIPLSREVCLVHLALPLTSLLQYADSQHYFI